MVSPLSSTYQTLCIQTLKQVNLNTNVHSGDI